ncbi:MAG: MotA/TolQ/ExbB proton channel family protein [SAR324 cluster bacterium]|nr:MotA/TolQ/ExbB proton channel family protein [SAR324 cluster bacterium]
MKCLNCKMENEGVAVYCQQCGAYLPVDKSTEYFDILKALLLGLTLVGGFYIIYLPVTEQYQIRALFEGRISEVITALTAWSLFLVAFKYLRFREQAKAFHQFRNQQMHAILAQGVYVRNADQRLIEISGYLQNKNIKKYPNSLIFRRIRRIFHHIKAIPQKEEINKIFDYQAQIDFNRMENSYSLLNVFIWAIPILGFIGTVYGIGEAIGEFSGFIRSVSTVELGSQMRSALGGVTGGLSIAFNTTFLALVFVIPIMVMSSFLRKTEEDLLLAMEEYCLEEVLPHLHIIPGSEVEREAFDEHMQKIMQLSGNWMARLEPLIESMTRYAGGLKHQIDGLQPMVKDFSQSLFTVKDKLSERSEGSSAIVDQTADNESMESSFAEQDQASVQNSAFLKQTSAVEHAELPIEQSKSLKQSQETAASELSNDDFSEKMISPPLVNTSKKPVIEAMNPQETSSLKEETIEEKSPLEKKSEPEGSS